MRREEDQNNIVLQKEFIELSGMMRRMTVQRKVKGLIFQAMVLAMLMDGWNHVKLHIVFEDAKLDEATFGSTKEKLVLANRWNSRNRRMRRILLGFLGLASGLNDKRSQKIARCDDNRQQRNVRTFRLGKELHK